MKTRILTSSPTEILFSKDTLIRQPRDQCPEGYVTLVLWLQVNFDRKQPRRARDAGYCRKKTAIEDAV